MKAAELREKSDTELGELERQLRDDLFRLKMKHYSNQLQQTSELRIKRRDIARVLTVINERKRSS
jgi:large subunit ribosomal protein L29